MHTTALANGKAFFDTYLLSSDRTIVVDVGAQDVNGSLRSVCPPSAEYIGVDFVSGKGVDVILDDPYQLPFADNSIDCVVCSSVFEHSELFWLLYLEVIRVLRPGGLFYLNVPSNGYFHRYPVDCWRFYPDSGRALVAWARRSGFDVVLLESFVARQSRQQSDEIWNDFVAVFLKDGNFIDRYPERILDTKSDIANGVRAGHPGFINESPLPEDLKRLFEIERVSGEHQYVQLFFDIGAGFSEDTSVRLKIKPAHGSGIQSFVFDLTGQGSLQNIRLDPINDCAVVVIDRMELVGTEAVVDLVPRMISNAQAYLDGKYYFEDQDPRFFFQNLGAAELASARELCLDIRYESIGPAALVSCRDLVVEQLGQRVQQLQAELGTAFVALDVPRRLSSYEEQARLILRDECGAAVKLLQEGVAGQLSIHDQAMQAHFAELATLRQQALEQKEALKSGFERVIDDMRREHQSALDACASQQAALVARHERMVDALREDHANALRLAEERERVLKSGFEQVIEDMRREHQSALDVCASQQAASVASHERTFNALRGDHANALRLAGERESSVRQDHEAVVEALRRERDDTSRELSALRSKVRALEETLSTIRGWRGFGLLAWMNGLLRYKKVD